MVWFRANYPGPDTIIHKPDWHSPKIYSAAMALSGRDDLLEAAEEAVRVLEDPRSTISMPNTYKKLKAAIAKAKGEQ